MGGAQRLIALAVAALCLVAAGCGGADDQAKRDRAYIESVNAAMQRFAATAKRLPSGFEAATLRRYSAALDDAAGSLRRIQPPDSVADLHRQLTTEVSGYADAIDQAARAPLSASPDRVMAAQRRLREATRAASTGVARTLTQIGKTLDANA